MLKKKQHNIKYINESRIAIMTVDTKGLTHEDSKARVREVNELYASKLKELGTQRLLVVPSSIDIKVLPLSKGDQLYVYADISPVDKGNQKEYVDNLNQIFSALFPENEIIVYVDNLGAAVDVEVKKKSDKDKA